MKTEQVGIEGVTVWRNKWNGDQRGVLIEVWRQADAPDFVPRQANLVTSLPQVARGMHWHDRQTDLWWVCQGSAVCALHDMRRGSPTEREYVRVRLAAGDAVLIPPGVAHGYFVDSSRGLTVCYLVDQPYDGGTDEHEYRWQWPDGAVLSDRDRDARELDDVPAEEFPVWEG